MNDKPSNLIDELGANLKAAAENLRWENALKPKGYVTRVGDGVAMVRGLNKVAFEELVQFDGGSLGMAYDLDEQRIGIVILTDPDKVHEDQGVVGLNRLPELPVGQQLLGRIVDSLGKPLDEGPPIETGERFPLFRPSPKIIERKSVDQSLWTGVMAIDSAIPIGRGQRELIIGDRNTGKTALAVDIVAAQQTGDVACVYVVIGQPMSRVLKLKEDLQQTDSFQNTVIVAADASSCPGMQYLAPYAGAAVAEWFCEQGEHALVIYDDLTKHADAYRELALLLDRPPGREAFPGDIFYVHSELLERAAARSLELGGGSVTALPLIETTEGDISSYIPTNLISITDGQIFLDSVRFEKNIKPAIDIGRSVSRIGSVAQKPPIRSAAKNLRIQISRFEALESLTKVGLEMDTGMQDAIKQGNFLRELLQQLRFANRSMLQQVIALEAVKQNWLEGIEPNQAPSFVNRLVMRVKDELPAVANSLLAGEVPEGDWMNQVKPVAKSLAILFQRESPSNDSPSRNNHVSPEVELAKPQVDKPEPPMSEAHE